MARPVLLCTQPYLVDAVLGVDHAGRRCDADEGSCGEEAKHAGKLVSRCFVSTGRVKIKWLRVCVNLVIHTGKDLSSLAKIIDDTSG